MILSKHRSKGSARCVVIDGVDGEIGRKIVSEEAVKKELTRDEAEKIGQRFLSSRYPEAQITFRKATLDIHEGTPFYYLEGKIRMPARNQVLYPLSFLFSPPLQHTFKLKIHASSRKLLNWELE